MEKKNITKEKLQNGQPSNSIDSTFTENKNYPWWEIVGVITLLSSVIAVFWFVIL